MRTLDRYLLRQITGPFIFGVVAFVLLFVSANILFRLTELVSQLGLSIWVAGELFVLWLPRFIVFTFPLATLVSILIVFGRLSGDSELVAMFAGGVSFRRLVVPLIFFGLLISLLTAALNEIIVPAAESRADTIVREATLRAGKEYQQQGVVDRQVVNGTGRVVIADSLNVATQEMVNPIIIEIRHNKPWMITTAEHAVWVKTDWKLINGSITNVGSQPPYSFTFDTGVAHFQESPQEIARHVREPNEMTYRELKAYIIQAVKNKEPIIDLELALYHKFSIPFACLVFALIAPALGIRSHRGSGSIGMGVAILIGFAYYVVWNYLSVLSQQGGITPFWAAWLPNLITAAIGIILILRVRR